jgi:hypothetical protein
MRYNNLFTRIVEGIGDSDPNTPMKKEKHVCNDDLVTKVSTNTQRQNRTRQRGKDMTNMQSSYVPHSRRSSSSTQKKHEANVSRGENNEGHAGGDDGEDPPPIDIEKSHVISQQKRKRSPSINDSQNSGSLRNVVDMEIDNAPMLDWVALRIVESQQIAEELAHEEPTIFEEQSLTLHNAKYNKEERKLQIEKVHVKNKKVTKTWNSKVDVSGVGPSGLLKLHLTTGDALSHSISEQELENIKLKRRITELEDTLSPKPLFAEPLAIVVPDQMPPSTPGTSIKVRKATKFLNGVRLYVTENINKRLTIISQAWEVTTSMRNLSQRIVQLNRIFAKISGA